MFLASVVGYLSMTIFVLITGLLMWVFETDMNVLDNGYANINTLFSIAPWIFLFLIPAVTMRSFAEEKKNGTIELILTRPISDFKIILSKFIAGFVLVVLSLLPTLLFYYSVHYLGNPIGNIDTGGMWGSYIGLLFLGATYVAIGVFTSSLTDNQIVSFILAMLLCLFMYTGFSLVGTFSVFTGINDLVMSLGIDYHYSSISRGVIDLRDVVYFVSIVAAFILATKTVLESRKW